METTKELFKALVADFDLPESRVKILSPANLRWLMRNMGIRNSSHPNYLEAAKLLGRLYKITCTEEVEEDE